MSKAQVIKNKLDFTKIKNLCFSKDIIKQVKRQLVELEKILIARLSEELNKNINNPIKIRGNSLTDISPKNIHDWPIKT